MIGALGRHVALATDGKVPGVRDVPMTKSSLYTPDTDFDFECFIDIHLITFSKVNDDYCDCADGSVEPGTATCATGALYSQNSGWCCVNNNKICIALKV